MKVKLISMPLIIDEEISHMDDIYDPTVEDPDLIHEYAGRICYRSWDKPNPETRTNESYLRKSILQHGHVSVLEHGSFTFQVEGVSRALLAEFTRHRHLSFSVESLRFCQPEGYVIHPLDQLYYEETREDLARAWQMLTELYFKRFDFFRFKGHTKKQAREAARMVLPLMTETDLVVTGNSRAWIDVLAKRWSPTADREIYDLAGLIAAELKRAAPNTFQFLAPVE